MKNYRNAMIAGALGFAACLPGREAQWPPPAPCPAADVVSTRSAVPTDVLIISGGTSCHESQKDLRAPLASATSAVTKRLVDIGFAGVHRINEPSAAELLEKLREPRRQPLLLVLTAHGLLHRSPSSPVPREPGSISTVSECPEIGAPCVSALCIERKLVDVDALVAAIAPERPFALLVVDACSSAHVDVRRARTRVSVLSAATTEQAMGVNGSGFLTEALARFDPGAADRDCDGAVTDVEWFDWLRNEVPRTRRLGVAPIDPKLRRQDDAAEIVLRAVHTAPASCGGSNVTDFGGPRMEDRWLAPRHRLYRGCVALDELDEALPGERRARIPMACADDIGQCFRFEESS